MVKIIAGVLLLVENLVAIAFLETFYVPIYADPQSPLYRTEMYGPVSGLRLLVYAFGIGACVFGLLCIWSGLRGLWRAK